MSDDPIIYMDGWDYLPRVDAQNAFDQFWNADGWYGDVFRMATSEGRFGIGNALHLRTFNVGPFAMECYKVMATRIEVDQFVLSFALKIPSELTTTYGPAISFYDSITAINLVTIFPFHLGSVCVSVPTNRADAPNAIFSGGAPIAGRSNPGLIKANTWHYVHMKVTTGLGGAIQVKVDGEIVIDLTSIDVWPAGAPAGGLGIGFDTLRLRTGQSTGVTEYWIDDLHLHTTDDAVTPYDDYLGNIRVGTQLPNGAGDETDFTAVGAATNWQAVIADYNMSITDPTYVQSDTPGDFDLYNFQTNVPARAIFGIQLTCFYRQTDAIQLYSMNQIKVNGTIYEGVERGVAQTYESRWTTWSLNPDTTVAWTNTDLADIQAGPKLNRSE
jgi:hypothetical protein